MEYKINCKKQDGFTIVSVAVAASIASVIALAISTLIVSQASSVSYLEDRLSRVALDNELQLNFSYPQTCINSLRGKPIAATQNITNLKDKNANEFISTSPASALSSFDMIRISSIKLVNDNATNAPNSTGNMNLLVNIERQRSSGPKELSPKELKLTVTTDASGNIDTCSLQSGSSGSEFEKACGMSPTGTLKNNCSGRAASGRASSSVCHVVASSETNFLHGDIFSKRTASGRESGGDTWAETSYWKCVNGSWVYDGTSGTAYGGRNNRLLQ